MCSFKTLENGVKVAMVSKYFYSKTGQVNLQGDGYVKIIPGNYRGIPNKFRVKFIKINSVMSAVEANRNIRIQFIPKKFEDTYIWKVQSTNTTAEEELEILIMDQVYVALGPWDFGGADFTQASDREIILGIEGIQLEGDDLLKIDLNNRQNGDIFSNCLIMLERLDENPQESEPTITVYNGAAEGE